MMWIVFSVQEEAISAIVVFTFFFIFSYSLSVFRKSEKPEKLRKY